MPNIVFIYDKKLSAKNKLLTVILNEREFVQNVWKSYGPKKVYYVSDIERNINLFPDIELIKLAVNSEITLRKKEGRFTSNNDELSKLRISLEILPQFLSKASDKKIICNPDGTPLSFNPSAPITPSVEVIKQNDIFHSAITLSSRNISDALFFADSTPMIFFYEDTICPLDKKITNSFLKTIPNKTSLNNTEFDLLSERLNKFKDRLTLKFPTRVQRKTYDKPICLPIINIQSDFQYAALNFNYPEEIIIKATDFSNPFIDLAKGVEINRNIKEETQYRKILEKCGMSFHEGPNGGWYLPSVKIERILTMLENEGFEIKLDNKNLNLKNEAAWEISSNNDKIFLKVNIAGNNKTANIKNIFEAVANKRSFFKLNDGSYSFFSVNLMEKFNSIKENAYVSDEVIEFKTSDIQFVNEILKNEKKISKDDSFESLLKLTCDYSALPKIDIPANLDSILRNYQKNGFFWLSHLRKHGLNGILADDMGLGKTLQILTLLLSIKEKSKENPSLLIVPSTLVFNWELEIKKFTPELTYIIHAGKERTDSKELLFNSDLIITTYPIIRRDATMLKEIAWNYIILDEAQTIKNPIAQTTKLIKQFMSKHKISISGTPVENSIYDLWSHFDFLMPGFLGDLEDFKSKFSYDTDSLEALSKKTKPFILRRLKSQVSPELPPKTEITLYCDFYPEQKKIYNETLLAGKRKIDIMSEEKGSKVFNILEIILRLRQIACHPSLAVTSETELQSGKLDLVLETAFEILSEGYKILIFSQFTEHLKIVKAAFNNYNIKNHYLDGKTTNRSEVIGNFTNDKNPCAFFISLKTGGLGLNLTEANYVFLLDPWWNPAVENQAIDRCHRIGQTNPVTVYRFITKDSIEEKVEQLKTHKKNMENILITETDMEGLPFTETILKDLLS